MNNNKISIAGANVLTIGGVGAMLAIAGLSLPVNGVIMAYTVAGCYHLSKKRKINRGVGINCKIRKE